jgi:hypothetical protein
VPEEVEADQCVVAEEVAEEHPEEEAASALVEEEVPAAEASREVEVVGSLPEAEEVLEEDLLADVDNGLLVHLVPSITAFLGFYVVL